MKLAKLCLIGTAQLGSMALAGKLRPKHLWTAVDGASKYRKAVAEGDIADEREQRRRVHQKCRRCPLWSDEPATKLDGVTKHFCGQPFEDRGADGCGCLVGVTVRGKLMPAGATVVKSCECPRGEW